MTTQVIFWSDFIDVPRTTYRNLKPETIKTMMRAALIDAGIDADIWANKKTIDSTRWTEQRFCMVIKDGVITDESALLEGDL